jgi:hypothetical protein
MLRYETHNRHLKKLKQLQEYQNHGLPDGQKYIISNQMLLDISTLFKFTHLWSLEILNLGL